MPGSPEDDLFRGLGLLSEDGLGLTSVSLLLAVVTTFALSLQRVLALLVLRHFVDLWGGGGRGREKEVVFKLDKGEMNLCHPQKVVFFFSSWLFLQVTEVHDNDQVKSGQEQHSKARKRTFLHDNRAQTSMQ